MSVLTISPTVYRRRFSENKVITGEFTSTTNGYPATTFYAVYDTPVGVVSEGDIVSWINVTAGSGVVKLKESGKVVIGNQSGSLPTNNTVIYKDIVVQVSNITSFDAGEEVTFNTTGSAFIVKSYTSGGLYYLLLKSYNGVAFVKDGEITCSGGTATVVEVPTINSITVDTTVTDAGYIEVGGIKEGAQVYIEPSTVYGIATVVGVRPDIKDKNSTKYYKKGGFAVQGTMTAGTVKYAIVNP